MTMSAERSYTAYRESVGGTNHDSTFTMPEDVSELGERQAKGWQAVAMDAENHTQYWLNRTMSEARKTIGSQSKRITELHNENFALKRRLAELGEEV